MKTETQDILYISESYASFVKDSVEETSKYFKEVSVLVRSNPIAEIANYIPINLLDPYKLSSKIDLIDKPSNISVCNTPILYGPLNSQYKKLGDKHLDSVEKAIKKLNINFDLIHSHNTWTSGYVGAKLKEKYHVPFVVTAHGQDIYDYPFRDAEWREKIRYVLNSADYIITVSNSNLSCIDKLNVTTPVKVLPNGYKTGLFYPITSDKCREKLNLPLDKKIILNVGWVEKVKGQQYLIDAVRDVINERKDIICIIVGSGELSNKLKSQVESSGLSNYFIFVGPKPHSEIPLWMNACDFFVLPSLNEGNPTVMFECLGCGKPFIGTNVGGIPEIITSEDYGYLVEPANSKDLAEKIVNALNKKWNYEKIALYGAQFTWEDITKEIVEIYEELFTKNIFTRYKYLIWE
ncbi:MAG: glycosyltransferase [Desulfitobacteriaceae bacterium]|nr:glycosyltransferase [Desulfitobacteriaceae bacterium]